jgi:GGDEF domain-containing protein
VPDVASHSRWTSPSAAVVPIDARERKRARRIKGVMGLGRDQQMARWGPGDESAILAPRRDAARQLAERLLLQLKKGSHSERSGISASVGIAIFMRDQGVGHDPDMLMRAADEALYRAKAGGCDQVNVACPCATIDRNASGGEQPQR